MIRRALYGLGILLVWKEQKASASATVWAEFGVDYAFSPRPIMREAVSVPVWNVRAPVQGFSAEAGPTHEAPGRCGDARDVISCLCRVFRFELRRDPALSATPVLWATNRLAITRILALPASFVVVTLHAALCSWEHRLLGRRRPAVPPASVFVEHPWRVR